jgi:hypothetical protein
MRIQLTASSHGTPDSSYGTLSRDHRNPTLTVIRILLSLIGAVLKVTADVLVSIFALLAKGMTWVLLGGALVVGGVYLFGGVRAARRKKPGKPE